MRVLYDIKDILEDELLKICKKDDISSTDLENTYKMVDIIKDISTIEAMHDAGYSQNYSEDWPMIRGARHDDYSYRRGRDAMGRYTSRDHDHHDKKESMIDELRVLMDEAKSDTERENIRRVVNQLDR